MRIMPACLRLDPVRSLSFIWNRRERRRRRDETPWTRRTRRTRRFPACSCKLCVRMRAFFLLHRFHFLLAQIEDNTKNKTKLDSQQGSSMRIKVKNKSKLRGGEEDQGKIRKNQGKSPRVLLANSKWKMKIQKSRIHNQRNRWRKGWKTWIFPMKIWRNSMKCNLQNQSSSYSSLEVSWTCGKPVNLFPRIFPDQNRRQKFKLFSVIYAAYVTFSFGESRFDWKNLQIRILFSNCHLRSNQTSNARYSSPAIFIEYFECKISSPTKKKKSFSRWFPCMNLTWE